MASGVTDKVKGMADKVTGKFDEMTGGMVSKTKDAVDGVLGWFGFAKDEAVDNSIIPDMVNAILGWFDIQRDGMVEKTKLAVNETLGEYDRLEKDLMSRHFGKNQAIFTVAKPMAITRATKSMKEYNEKLVEANELEETNRLIMQQLTEDYNNGTSSLIQTADAMQHFGIQSDTAVGKAASVASSIKSGFAGMADSVTGTFFDMFTGVTSAFDGLRSIARSVFSMISQVLIKAYIVKPLLAMMGIPMFAQGGLAAGGAPAIVGENGPELIVPSSNTRVFSNSQSKGILNASSDSQPVTVNFNINAIDSQSGVEFLMEQEGAITGIVQDAFNRRGRSGPYG